jgi:ParB-like chromosome segregation protein Spo0J
MTTPNTNEQGKPTSPPAPTYYPIHPLANLFPRMTKDEYKRVLDSIRTNGQLQPITLFQSAVLDGRHRQDACEELGRDVAFTEFKGSYDDALKFVISQNLERRHLNPSQLGLIAAEIANLKKGANQHTKQDGSIDLASAAKIVGVSEKSAKRARDVLVNAAPEVVEKIRDGAVRVGAVTKDVLKLPKDKQLNAVTVEPVADANTACTNAENSLIKKLEALPLDEVEVRVPAMISKLRATVTKLAAKAEKKKEAA